jgi:predicted XRE-type DNA-binding protein
MQRGYASERKANSMARSVFHALGRADADEQVAKAQVAIAILERFEKGGLNNVQAAAAAGVCRADVGHLKAMRLSRFTLGWLMRALGQLDPGTHVRVVIEPRSAEEAGSVLEAAGP